MYSANSVFLYYLYSYRFIIVSILLLLFIILTIATKTKLKTAFAAGLVATSCILVVMVIQVEWNIIHTKPIISEAQAETMIERFGENPEDLIAAIKAISTKPPHDSEDDNSYECNDYGFYTGVYITIEEKDDSDPGKFIYTGGSVKKTGANSRILCFPITYLPDVHYFHYFPVFDGGIEYFENVRFESEEMIVTFKCTSPYKGRLSLNQYLQRLIEYTE